MAWARPFVVVDAQHGRAGLGERVRSRGADALAGAQHDEPAALELEQLRYWTAVPVI